MVVLSIFLEHLRQEGGLRRPGYVPDFLRVVCFRFGLRGLLGGSEEAGEALEEELTVMPDLIVLDVLE